MKRHLPENLLSGGDNMVEKEATKDCSTAGMGYAKTDKNNIAPEDCQNPKKGFAQTDFKDKKKL